MRVLRWVILVGVAATQLGAVAGGAQSDDLALYAPLVEKWEAPLASELDATLPHYEITTTFTPASASGLARLTGSVAVDYVNTTGASQAELNIRLYPNNPEYEEGAITVEGLEIDGAPVDSTLAVDDTLLSVELETPLADQDRLSIAATFRTTVPTNLTHSYGMFRYDSALEVYALAHWFPMLAGIDPDGAWLTSPLSENGDPVFSNAALFDVELTAPDGMVVVTSGSVVDERAGAGGTVYRFASGPSRDFVMAASERFEMIDQQVGKTLVRSFAVDGFEDGNQRTLTAAAQSLAVYGRLFGEYLYDELDLVQVPLGGGAGGVEFPGIMYIGADYYDDPRAWGEGGYLEFVVAHEVGHQWWYGVVGNNQYAHAFIDEALTNYLTAVYLSEQYGDEVGDLQTARYLMLPYLNLLFNRGGDEIVDQPTDDFADQNVYSAIVYGKGALGFGALNEEIGDEAFFLALRVYYGAYRFDVATPDDLLTTFEIVSGQELDALWEHWFEAAEGDQDYDESDLADLLIEIGR